MEAERECPNGSVGCAAFPEQTLEAHGVIALLDLTRGPSWRQWITYLFEKGLHVVIGDFGEGHLAFMRVEGKAFRPCVPMPWMHLDVGAHDVQGVADIRSIESDERQGESVEVVHRQVMHIRESRRTLLYIQALREVAPGTHAPAGQVAGFQQRDGAAGFLEFQRRAEPRHARTDDDDGSWALCAWQRFDGAN